MPTPARTVAVLSGIHGVLPALESVLAEPEVAGADRIVLTGDLAAGPLPRETLDLLAPLATGRSGLPLTAVLEVAGLGTVLFCHATPRDDEEVVLADSRLERWAEVLGSVGPEVGVVVCGHTHMPFSRLAHGRLVVNPGSVGMPYGRPGAHWALLGPGAQLRRTMFDPGTAGRARARSHPSRLVLPADISYVTCVMTDDLSVSAHAP
jgi:predicted phosphodiesterase